MSTHSHQHAHGHDHQHEHHSLAELNAQHFDAQAHTYDELPSVQELTRRLSASMLEAYAFDEDRTVVMDFACGTGLVSRALALHAKTLVGVDISQGMVDQYNLRATNQGIPPEEMRAMRVELKGEESELEVLGGQRFDVVVCSMAYHHFASINDVSRTLAYFLKPSGVLLVTDIMESVDGKAIIPENHQHIVAHAAGLGQSAMRTAFESAGLGGFEYTKATSALKEGRNVDFFIAKGVKPDAM
ncbi:hypothetical protein EW146_g2932 [Bondarzewia mesenterica]|uniref:Methyltransferase type 11 domain-containing protein n=1 Tax=Bondarzewia mesenterica TaxID=1095465 RepID=A0A4V3XFM0_9AGAM|nr:hypothetical protein EW146_g2932 [Bondarzewia mesenterica]